MTIGELADQKHQTNRTVVMDVMVCLILHSYTIVDILSRSIHHH
jgi:hypothetical protein